MRKNWKELTLNNYILDTGHFIVFSKNGLILIRKIRVGFILNLIKIIKAAKNKILENIFNCSNHG